MYKIIVLFTFLLILPNPSHAGLFCEGFDEGYIEGFEQESKTVKAPAPPAASDNLPVKLTGSQLGRFFLPGAQTKKIR
jgi:hypothetical protein